MKRVRKKASAANHVWTLAGVLLCACLLPILIINCTLLIREYTGVDKVPSFGGVFPMIVLTDSMRGTFESGDLIICQITEPEQIDAGDVICFFDPMSSGKSIVTHRVTEVTSDSDGNLAWKTKGDSNNAEDIALVRGTDLVGIYKFHLPGLGKAAMFMQTTSGLLLCVVLPLLLLLGYDGIRRQIYEKRNRQDADALRAELEQLRAKKCIEMRENENNI